MNLLAGGTQRIALDETSWIEHIPGWLAADAAAHRLTRLICSAGREQRGRWMVNRRVLEPRLTAEYNDLTHSPDPALIAAASALSGDAYARHSLGELSCRGLSVTLLGAPAAPTHPGVPALAVTVTGTVLARKPVTSALVDDVDHENFPGQRLHYVAEGQCDVR